MQRDSSRALETVVITVRCTTRAALHQCQCNFVKRIREVDRIYNLVADLNFITALAIPFAPRINWKSRYVSREERRSENSSTSRGYNAPVYYAFAAKFQIIRSSAWQYTGHRTEHAGWTTKKRRGYPSYSQCVAKCVESFIRKVLFLEYFHKHGDISLRTTRLRYIRRR